MHLNSPLRQFFILCSVIALGYGTELKVTDNQTTEANSVLPNTEQPIKLPSRLTLPVQSLPPEFVKDSIVPLASLEVELSATDWSWRVRRCGVFAGQVLDCRVRSPHPVLVDFDGFANYKDANSNLQINTWYAISQSAPPPPGSNSWISANMLNFADFIVPASIGGTTWNLWCKIEVTDNIKAGEYFNKPTITFVLKGVEQWIETEILGKDNFRFSERRLGTY